MGYLEKYNEWLNDTAINEKDKEELRNIKRNGRRKRRKRRIKIRRISIKL